jgi:hypothetical protein
MSKKHAAVFLMITSLITNLLPNALAIDSTPLRNCCALPVRPPIKCSFEAQALSAAGESFSRGPENSRATFRLWKKVGAVIRKRYPIHAPFRIGSIFAAFMIGWMTIFKPETAKSMMTFDHSFRSLHEVWSVMGLLLVVGTILSRSEHRLLSGYSHNGRQSYLFFTTLLFSTITFSSAVALFGLHDETFYEASCFYRNSVAMLWSFRTFVELNGLRILGNHRVRRWVLHRELFAVIAAPLLILSGAPDFMRIGSAIDHETLAGLAQDYGLWSWTASCLLYSIWLLWPHSTNHAHLPEVTNLVTRMRQRVYPETSLVLANQWYLTLLNRGYAPRQWRRLARDLRDAVQESIAKDGPFSVDQQKALDTAIDWLDRAAETDPSTQKHESSFADSVMSHPPEQLRRYLTLLMNEWLPWKLNQPEVGTDDHEFQWEEGDNAYRKIARVIALHLSEESILLDPKTYYFSSSLPRQLMRIPEEPIVSHRLVFSDLEILLTLTADEPELVLPLEREILMDVILSFIGRTDPPPQPPLLTPMNFSAKSPVLLPHFDAALKRAYRVHTDKGVRLIVPIGQGYLSLISRSINKKDWAPSRLITPDGFLWSSMGTDYSNEGLSLVYSKEFDSKVPPIKFNPKTMELELRGTEPLNIGSGIEPLGQSFHLGDWIWYPHRLVKNLVDSFYTIIYRRGDRLSRLAA